MTFKPEVIAAFPATGVKTMHKPSWIVEYACPYGWEPFSQHAVKAEAENDATALRRWHPTLAVNV